MKCCDLHSNVLQNGLSYCICVQKEKVQILKKLYFNFCEFKKCKIKKRFLEIFCSLMSKFCTFSTLLGTIPVLPNNAAGFLSDQSTKYSTYTQ